MLLDVASGAIHTFKTLTTPARAGRGRARGLATSYSPSTASPETQSRSAVHGTTLITNALIEREGAVTGSSPRAASVTCSRCARRCVTTSTTCSSPSRASRPAPAPARGRTSASMARERCSQRWTAESLRRSRQIFEEAGVDLDRGVFPSFLHEPRHERLAGAWLREHMPAVSMSLSCRGRTRDPRVRANVDDRVQRIRPASRARAT